jgi:very-short-patch-repair endonuclease
MDAHEELRDFAKTLRRRMSLPEVLLWRAIKGRQLAGTFAGSTRLDRTCSTSTAMP